jgi:Zn-dependent M28 family amino/carboxypeptidase
MKTKMYDDVKFLTEIDGGRHHLNLDGLNNVADYISNEFKSSNLDISEQIWYTNGRMYRNIIGSYNRDSSKKLIVGGHYDTAGALPGADDNASAIAGLLQLARLLDKNKPELDYGIELVAYCLEEPPYFGGPDMGSYIHAESLKKNRVDVIGMLCFEMIGYFSDLPGSQTYPTIELTELYPTVGNFIAVAGTDTHCDFTNRISEIMSINSEIDIETFVFPDDNGFVALSDNRNYLEFGFPAVMISDTAFFRNKNYHTVSDTIDTLDFEKMGYVIDSTYNAIINM